MRILSVLAIVRLIFAITFPAVALAASTDTFQNQNQDALIQIKNGKFEKIDTNSSKQLDNITQDISDDSGIVYGENGEIAFYGKPIRILVTGYSSTPDQCWGDPFITASGKRVHLGTMACPPQYPFGTKIKIEGAGTFVCEDRGGAIKGNHFDRWFESRGEALQWGKRVVVAQISK